jgi:DNA modification methylase
MVTTMNKHTSTHADGLLIEWWPIERPIPYGSNPRSVPESAIEKVAASLQEFGWRQPIVVDTGGVIIVGHTRLLAARRLGLAQVPIHVARDLTAAQAKSYRLMDNRSAQETSWDPELLPIELEALLSMQVDPALTGFSNEEIAALLSKPTEGLTDPDEIPEVPEEPISKPGDQWILGNHRLLCGDSTKAEDVIMVMDGKRASLMATDPPYLVGYDGGNHPQTWGKDGEPITSEEKTRHWDSYIDREHAVGLYRDFLCAAIEHALIERPLIYQWFGMMRIEVVLEAWRANGLLPHQVIIWHKSRPVLARCDFMWDFEPALYGWLQGKRPEPELRPPANARCVWDIDQREGVEEGLGSVHPTIKPVELIRRPIEWHTKPGGLLYEPFSGSGTAIIAAEMTGRVCYALELSPAFVDVAVSRWENFTGKKAVCER